MALPTGFDALQYIASYDDLIAFFGLDAAGGTNHWNTTGQFEGRNPFLFSPLDYIASYLDLTTAFKDDADLGFSHGSTHFIANGFDEGRSRDLFDNYAYLASYTDLILAAAGVADKEQFAVQHYLQSGFDEGRSVSFDTLQYVASSIDPTLDQVWVWDGDSVELNPLFGSGWVGAPDRIPTGVLGEVLLYDPLNPIPWSNSPSGLDPALSNDPEFYFDGADGDLIDAFGTDTNAAGLHYIQNGFFEGRPTDLFFEWSYLASYEDLITAFRTGDISQDMANLPDIAAQHWINFGSQEGRKTNDWYDPTVTGDPDSVDTFNPFTYANANPDLITAYVLPRVQEAIDNGAVINDFFDIITEAQGLLNEALEDLSMHYVLFGNAEGRDPFAATAGIPGGQDNTYDGLLNTYNELYTQIAALLT
jgi:hypothetical protein